MNPNLECVHVHANVLLNSIGHTFAIPIKLSELQFDMQGSEFEVELILVANSPTQKNRTNQHT
jgi:hypothetical protein